MYSSKDYTWQIWVQLADSRRRLTEARDVFLALWWLTLQVKKQGLLVMTVGDQEGLFCSVTPLCFLQPCQVPREMD